MILIAESINIMSNTLGPAMKERDPGPIQEMARAEAEAGADYLDINIGPARRAMSRSGTAPSSAARRTTSMWRIPTIISA